MQDLVMGPRHTQRSCIHKRDRCLIQFKFHLVALEQITSSKDLGYFPYYYFFADVLHHELERLRVGKEKYVRNTLLGFLSQI